MVIANFISYFLVILGGLNWGLVGIFNFDAVAWISGGRNVASIIIYILIAVAALWLLISAFVSRGRVRLMSDRMGME